MLLLICSVLEFQIIINHQGLVSKRTQDGLGLHCSAWQQVKSKETVGNCWAVLKVILGHKYVDRLLGFLVFTKEIKRVREWVGEAENHGSH